jgi:hypothetical protein
MPLLETLSLYLCQDLQMIPPFRSLKRLSLFLWYNINYVSYCPDLKQGDLDGCESLTDVRNFSHLVSLDIQGCYSIINIEPLGKVTNLNVGGSTNKVFTLSGVEGNELDYRSIRRKVGVCLLSRCIDFSFCRNIYELELFSLDMMTSCAEIMNIHFLTVKHCDNLTTSQGLRNITGSITFEFCDSLSLLDVQKIPEVAILSCKDITDFSGLGNNDKLTIRGQSNFETFQKDHPKISDTIGEVVFGKN